MLSDSRVIFRSAVLALVLSAAGAASLAAQPVDLRASGVIAPVHVVPIKLPTPVRMIVANVGDNPIGTYACNVVITNLATQQVVFSTTTQGPRTLIAGASDTVTAQQSWTPAVGGRYQVRLQVQAPNDIGPNDNVSLDTVLAQLSLSQAIATFDSEVYATHPQRQSLVAWLVRPPNAPADSLFAPGAAIRPADTAFVITDADPLYFFFVDLHPELLYSHPCEFVTVSARTGTLARRAAEFWPVINDTDAVFGPACGPNPNRVHGNAANCEEKQNRYVAVPTANTGDCALVVVGKLNLDVEKNTVDQDICRWKERINGSTYGPHVTGPNISVNFGPNNCGLTKQELCDAIDALKGKNCPKVFFKYIGHGTERGLVVWNAKHTDSEILSYKELAKKFKEAGLTQVCIEITACHSGGLIPELEKAGIKGVVVTSSSTSNTTPVGDGSGTPWEKALEGCSKDSLANVNRDPMIDLCELYAWVKAKGGAAANGPLPQISKLSDSLKFGTSKIEQVGGTQSISTNAGSIRFIAERFCVKTRYRTGQTTFRDTIAYRGAVYMVNPGGERHTSAKRYRVVARCKGMTVVLVEEIVPDVDANGRICIANLPDDCTGIAVQEVKKKGRTWRDDPPAPMMAGDTTFFESLSGTTVHDDSSRFAFYRYEIAGPATDQAYRASVTGPSGWTFLVEPDAFSLPAATTGDLFTAAAPPAGSTYGGAITTTLAMVPTGDTVELRYRMLLRDSVGGAISAPFTRRFNWVDVIAPATVTSNAITLDNAHIEAAQPMHFISGTTAAWSFLGTSMNVADGAAADYVIGGGTHTYTDVVLRGLDDGIHITAGDGVWNGVVAGDSRRDGFVFEAPTYAGWRLQSLHAIGAARFGARIAGNATATLKIDGLTVGLADSLDVVVEGTRRLECTDCDYEEARVAVDGGASLARYASIAAAVRDSDDLAVEGATVTMTDSLGRRVFSGVTDANGTVRAQRVLISERTGGEYHVYLPITVVMQKGTDQRRTEYRGATYRQIPFIVGRDITAVPAITGNAVRTTLGIIPQPARRGGAIVVRGGFADGEVLRGDVVDLLGRVVARFDDVAARGGAVTLDLAPFGMSPGLYFLSLERRGLSRSTGTFIVE